MRTGAVGIASPEMTRSQPEPRKDSSDEHRRADDIREPVIGGGAAFTMARARAALLATTLAMGLAACGSAPENPVVAMEPETTAKPQRIVSLNLCTDQLLMQMVDHRRIRALTYLASDARSSGMAEEARRLPATTGAAEQVIAMRPDLVLAGPFSTRDTVAILRRLGYRVMEFAPEADFAAIRANIERMAQAVGEPDRGAAMIGTIDAALAAVPPPPPMRPVYANYDANGFTSGDGSLLTEVANVAGFDTLGQRLGFAGMRQVSLEQMLVERPDAIDIGDGSGAPALATEIYRHPALQRLLDEQQQVAIPGKYTGCGTMLTLRALDAFVAARHDLS